MSERLDQPLSQIMTTEVTTVPARAALGDAVRTLLDRGVTGLPVVADTGEVVGVLSLADVARKVKGQSPTAEEPTGDTVFYDNVQIEDLLRSALRGSPEGTVRDFMSARVLSLQPDSTVREAARMMVDRKIHRVLVTDAKGKLLGIVSTLDIVDHVSR
jgi:CBS domain-containing protein